MNVLVVGSGGREHALVWKLKQSKKIEGIYVAPGNAGTALLAENIPITTKEDIVSWLKTNKVDLVVVGPDSYLAEGIVDDVQEIGIPVFGPTKAAAKIEWSKAFAKQLMHDVGIPTATSQTFNEIGTAKEYLKGQSFPVVVKADGLAFGKGVVIARNISEAEQALQAMMEEKKFGEAGSQIVIEEFLIGKEISTHAFCDGVNTIMFPTSQDRKRAYDGDNGPNTGGMGTIAPVPDVSIEVLEQIEKMIVKPALEGLRNMGCPFIGVLYPGIMLTDDGPKVIEFNARFGDPETQSYMRILESDLVDVLLACIDGTLNKLEVEWKDQYASCIVIASEGYPNKYEKGFPIRGLNEIQKKENIVLFHAGTVIKDNEVVTNGGRVLNVTATGSSLNDALNDAYEAISEVSFDGMQFRKDIGRSHQR